MLKQIETKHFSLSQTKRGNMGRIKSRKHTGVQHRQLNLGIKIGGALVLVVLLLNAGMWIAYRHKVLPHYQLGQLSVGNMSYTKLGSITTNEVLPPELTLVHGTTQETRSPEELGVGLSMTDTLVSVQQSHSWFPLLSLFIHHALPLHLSVDQGTYAKGIAGITSSFTQQPQYDHIIFNSQSFSIKSGANGYTIDATALKQSITQALQNGKSMLMVPTAVLAAGAHSTDLTSQVAQLQKSLDVSIGYTYNGKTIHPSKADIGSWYTQSGQTMVVSDAVVTSYVKSVASQLGTSVANPGDMAVATDYVLGRGLSRDFAITPASATQLRTYCTAALDESDSNLSDLIGKLAATYNDVRGWNNGGKIAFEHVASGCQYTVWISASSQMTSFGAICDDYYNCQVGTNVILNYDRWTSATDPWNKTGGSLEDYRTLMIDHETGHRLGFYDNPTCPGAGQPAPVMMQQSINLKGCVFNIWPLTSEFTQLDSMLNINPTATTASD